MSADQPSVTIRPARAEDAPTLARLSVLDSAPMPRGRVLIADVGGEAVAAFGIETGQSVADPFRPTAEVVELLALRAQRARVQPQRHILGLGRLRHRRSAPRPHAA